MNECNIGDNHLFVVTWVVMGVIVVVVSQLTPEQPTHQILRFREHVSEISFQITELFKVH